jgi:TRAP-type uncharacterized transport system fused permease subunit
LGIIAYIVPFLFVYFPALVFIGSWGQILIAVTTAILGCFVLSGALTGYIFRELGPIKRLFLGLVGVGLLIPIHSQFTTSSSILNIVSGALALLLIIWEWYGGRRK